MESFINLVKERRSIRNYDTTASIPHQDLELCVEAARYAPSACNSQPWKFIIIDEGKQREDLIKTFASGFYKMNSFVKNAKAFIVLISEKPKFTAWAGGKVMRTDFTLTDIGIACSHIVLEAQELGIGTCILGWFNERKIKKILNIPRNKKIRLIVSCGYPSSPLEIPEKPLKEIDEVRSLNQY